MANFSEDLNDFAHRESIKLAVAALRPTRGQIILEKIEKDSELYVSTKEQGYEKGLVVASGSPHVQPGVTALFTTYGPISVRHEGKEYTIAKEEDIISTL